MTSAPPGWYPDASQPGHERWWDGGSWSEVTRPAPGAQQTQPAPQTTTDPARQDPYAQQAPSSYGQEQQTQYPEYPQYPQYPQYQQPSGASYPGYGGPPVGKTTPDGVPTANPWRRLAARIIDGLIIGAVVLIIGLPLVRDIVDQFRGYLDQVQAAANAGRPTPDSTTFVSNVLASTVKLTLLQLVVAAIYQIPQIKLRGATLGKMALRIRVRPMDVEGLPSWGQAVLRFVGFDLFSAVPNIGGFYALLDSLWCLWDPRRQCLHDKMARTAVVNRR
jgi:uncharacterized RDD family membrane protein YckC